jgi:hypothetical protein
MSREKPKPSSEGLIVGIASLAMVLGLAGVLGWQTYGPGAVRADDSAGGKGEAEIAGLQAELAAAVDRVDAGEQKLAQAEAKWIEDRAATELEVDGYRQRVRDLTDENGRLRNDVKALERETRALEGRVAVLADAASIASTRAVTGPETPAAVATGLAQNEVAARALNDARVVDAKEAIGYVVLDVGSDEGVKAGMSFTVLNGDQVVAQLRASDVEAKVTGATVETIVGERFPQADDRAILTRHADR